MTEDDKRARFQAELERRRAAAKRGSFSLEAFYAKRVEDGTAAEPMPPVELREDLPEVETSQVGVPPPIEIIPDDEGVA